MKWEEKKESLDRSFWVLYFGHCLECEDAGRGGSLGRGGSECGREREGN